MFLRAAIDLFGVIFYKFALATLANPICANHSMKKGARLAAYPFRSEQPHDCGDHRGQFGVEYPSQTKTVQRTVRPTGFEDKKHAHRRAPIFVRGVLT